MTQDIEGSIPPYTVEKPTQVDPLTKATDVALWEGRTPLIEVAERVAEAADDEDISSARIYEYLSFRLGEMKRKALRGMGIHIGSNNRIHLRIEYGMVWVFHELGSFPDEDV